MFPQYSTTTTLSIFELIKSIVGKDKSFFKNIRISAVNDFHNHDLYIESCASKISTTQQRIGKPDKLLFSFHGIPQSYVCEDEPYQLDPETIYFITKLLNDTDLIKIRNRVLTSALPLRV